MACHRRHADVPVPSGVRLQRVVDEAARERVDRGHSRAERCFMTFDFGKNHWLLFGVSFFGFIALAYVVGIGPAIWVQNHSQPLPGSIAPTGDRDRRAHGLHLRGLWLLPYPASAATGDGRDLGTAVGPWRLRVRAAGQHVATVHPGGSWQ